MQKPEFVVTRTGAVVVVTRTERVTTDLDGAIGVLHANAWERPSYSDFALMIRERTPDKGALVLERIAVSSFVFDEDERAWRHDSGTVELTCEDQSIWLEEDRARSLFGGWNVTPSSSDADFIKEAGFTPEW